MALLSKECCTLPPVETDYTPKGKEIMLDNDLLIYEPPKKGNSKIMLICAYDIFGFHPNIKQLCDKLSESGEFQVVEPDFLRGNAMAPEQGLVSKILMQILPTFVIKKIGTSMVNRRANWENQVKPDLHAVIKHYEEKEGIETFGIFGFCFGGKVAMNAAGDPELAEKIKAAVLIHPSLLEDKDPDAVKIPMLFIPSKDEPDLLPMVEKIKKNLGEGNVEHVRFDDVKHGFCGARGDWVNNEAEKKRTDEAMALTNTFFRKHLLKNT